MTLSTHFLEGVERAELDVRLVISHKERIEALYSQFIGSLDGQVLAKLGVDLMSDSWNLLVIDAETKSEIARVVPDLAARDFHYSDFRGIPKYPLPIGPQSFEVLAKYIGLSVGWFRAGRQEYEIPGYRTTIVLPSNLEELLLK